MVHRDYAVAPLKSQYSWSLQVLYELHTTKINTAKWAFMLPGGFVQSQWSAKCIDSRRIYLRPAKVSAQGFGVQGFGLWVEGLGV